MNSKNKIWWFVGISLTITFFIFLIVTFLFWNQLTPEEKIGIVSILKNNLSYIFTAAILLIAGAGFAVDGIFHNYIRPLRQLIKEIPLIYTVNPPHRVRLEGSRDIQDIINTINEGAEQYEELQKNVEKRILDVKNIAEEEKNMLAAFLSELPEGILICNTEGRILFYNKQAKQVLEQETCEKPCFIGLGRSVFGIIDRHLIDHAIDDIEAKLKRKLPQITSHFVIRGKDDNLLKVEAAPVLNAMKQSRGFILTFSDITRQIETEKQMDILLQSLLQNIRASLASIRAAIEAIREYPDMKPEQLNQFGDIIYTESVQLSDFLNKTSVRYSEHIKTRAPLVQMPARDLFETVRKKASEKLGISIQMEKCDENTWIKVESYSIILAILFVAKHLKTEVGRDTFGSRIEKGERFVNIDLIWEGQPVKSETLRTWYDQVLNIEGDGVPLTLKEVISHHDAEIWCHSCREAENKSYFRFFLPGISSPAASNSHNFQRNTVIAAENAAEFYDFDLFSLPSPPSESDNNRFDELIYTVFSTENMPNTDEIISISALRIVNGRLLHEEIFDQHIDPQNIQAEMLPGQSGIRPMIRLFHRFAEDTVLLGHNIASDMRMMQTKLSETGFRFMNPVLDTLLLSTIIHPERNNHELEEIAKRLGIQISGRHTISGNAVTTGEVFLKLIPLLEKQGIYTLKQAKAACQKRLVY